MIQFYIDALIPVNKMAQNVFGRYVKFFFDQKEKFPFGVPKFFLTLPIFTLALIGV